MQLSRVNFHWRLNASWYDYWGVGWRSTNLGGQILGQLYAVRVRVKLWELWRRNHAKLPLFDRADYRLERGWKRESIFGPIAAHGWNFGRCGKISGADEGFLGCGKSRPWIFKSVSGRGPHRNLRFLYHNRTLSGHLIHHRPHHGWYYLQPRRSFSDLRHFLICLEQPLRVYWNSLNDWFACLGHLWRCQQRFHCAVNEWSESRRLIPYHDNIWAVCADWLH